MSFDKKSLIAALMTLALPLVASAQNNFPFTIKRDAKGTLTRIELPLRTAMMSDDEDTLGELKQSLKDFQAPSHVEDAGPDAIIPQTDDDKKAYAEAKAYLRHDLTVSTLEDVRLEKEYSSAKSELLKIELYRLLAAPNSPNEFDRETIVTEAVKQILGKASKIFGAVPLFDVFNFLVDQYVETLESRREFYQNQLLAIIASDDTTFTDSEKDLIRSSVFYSRISIINLPARNKAKKAWSDYGPKKLAELVKPCKGFVGSSEKAFGQCFKVSGSLIVNRMIKKSVISKSVSLAFDSTNTTRVRAHRRALILAELGLALLPVTGIAKWPLNRWLSSQYVNQRKSEGFLYGHAVMQGQSTLANWVLVNSANPIISK